MEIGKPEVVLAIIVIASIAWIINNWIRAKHGYPIEGEASSKSELTDPAEAQRLKAENRELHDKLDTMQDRMIVLEKIVTDRGYTLAEEIEALRSQTTHPDNGVPLSIQDKEKA